MARASSANLMRLLVFGALPLVLLAGVIGVLWLGNLRFAGQPSLFERPFLPRTALVGDLLVEAPRGYGVQVHGSEGWVGRTRPTVDLRQVMTGLRLHAGPGGGSAERWARRAAECAGPAGRCRVLTDTVGSTVVECYETEGRSAGGPDGSYSAECRVVDGSAAAFYLCVDASCEVLRAVALTSLGSERRAAASRVP